MADNTLTKPTNKLGKLAIPLAVTILVYLPTLYDLVYDWYTDSNYSHGFLIPLVSIYLIWTTREQLSKLPVKPTSGALAILLAGIGMFVVGTAAAEYFTARMSFVLTLFGLTWYLLGYETIKKTWFAFFFLCFMIPVPYVIYYTVSFPMQLIATKITVGTLNVIGMGVVRQGNIIHLAGGLSLEVADACSGIRSLVSLLALGAIYAYWTQKKLLAQAILFLSTIPIAVFANVIRVLVTTLAASLGLTEITEEPLHSVMGLSVFVVAFICLILAGAIVRRIFK